MSSPRHPSNFERFQQVLKKRHNGPAIGKTAPHHVRDAPVAGLSPVGEASTSFTGESEPASDRVSMGVIEPFLRQTIRWDQELQREMELLEVPNEDWTIWRNLDTVTIHRAWIRHQRRFDKSGVKIADLLILQDATEILQILFWDLEEADAPWKELSGEISDIPANYYKVIRRYHEPGPLRKLGIYHQSFRALFFRILAAEKKMQMSLSSSTNKTLKTLTKFLDDIFPGAKEIQHEAYQNAQISYPYVWTLFQPGDIVYEERSIRSFHERYEQCFRVRRAKDAVSRYDGSTVLRLTLEEVIYMPNGFIKSGPRLILTARHIRKYDGLKQITTRDMGIIPFNIVSTKEQIAIRARLTQRGRRFLQLSALPFSIWNYKGPLGLVNSTAGQGTMEETRLSLEERLWQKCTHQNVVIDLETSENHFLERFSGWLHDFHDSEYYSKAELTEHRSAIDISEITQSKDDTYVEQSLLICRGYLPAYLLSSSDYAVGIIVSELSPPLWEQETQQKLATLSLPDMSHWHALVREFFKEGEDLEANLERRETRGSGLVLALQGPRIVTKIVADNISERLQRPLVAVNSTEQDQNLAQASKAALRWGGILFVDHRKVPTGRQAAKGLELANCSLFYPSVLLISCDSTTDLGEACEDATDGVISCNILSEDPVAELWKLYLTSNLPDFTNAMSDQRLGDICRLLAQLETRETRMEKIVKTAKRIAVTEKSPVGLSNILVVIQSSFSADGLEKCKDKIRAAGLEERG